MTAQEAPLSRIGKYEVVRVIGSGGGGVVYEAIHPELKKRVAVKTLHSKLAENQEALRRFLREGEAASRIRHPHVVDVTDVGVHEGQPYLVMELLEGKDLKAYLAERGPLPLAEAVDLMLPVIAAVGAGHDAGVIHRDLKPHNVFIASSRGVGPHPKVLDFGVSKLLDGNLNAISFSGVEVMMGTLCYMAPEQVRGLRHLDGRVDQYALGLILYECLTGDRVHAGDDQVAIIRAISEGIIQPPRATRPDLPESFEATLLQALSTRPEDRFATVYDFGRALLPFAGPRAGMVWKVSFEALPTPPRRAAAVRATMLLEEPAMDPDRSPDPAIVSRPLTATLPPAPPSTRRRWLGLVALSIVPVVLGASIAALVARRRRAALSQTPEATVEMAVPSRRASIEALPNTRPPADEPAPQQATAPDEPLAADDQPASSPAAAAPAEEPPDRQPADDPPSVPAEPAATAATAPAVTPPPPAAPAPSGLTPPADPLADPAAPLDPTAEAAEPAAAPARRRSRRRSESYKMGANQAPIITD